VVALVKFYAWHQLAIALLIVALLVLEGVAPVKFCVVHYQLEVSVVDQLGEHVEFEELVSETFLECYQTAYVAEDLVVFEVAVLEISYAAYYLSVFVLFVAIDESVVVELEKYVVACYPVAFDGEYQVAVECVASEEVELVKLYDVSYHHFEYVVVGLEKSYAAYHLVVIVIIALEKNQIGECGTS
jgi:hypothetical protein